MAGLSGEIGVGFVVAEGQGILRIGACFQEGKHGGHFY
jgi:hypothetical protein